MNELLFLTPNVAALLISLLACVLTVLTKGIHGRYTFDSFEGIQRAHTQATPRIGGAAIFLGISCAAPMADQATRELLYPTLLASTPAFLFGLAEDLTKLVSATQRLLATMASGVLGWYITGVSLTSLGVPGLDLLLSWGVISVTFTAFAIGGVANAVNLIDGYNGMASGFVVLALLALASVAADVGDAALAQTALLTAAGFLGLLFVNWPMGKLFLGDSGAYLGGFIVSWLCVLLTHRNDSVSPFAALLLCIHPITETIYSLWRRLRSGTSPGQPDTMHLHNVICFRLIPLVNGQMKVANPLSGLTMAGVSIPSAVLVSSNYTSGLTCAFLSIMFAVCYLASYLVLGKGLKRHSSQNTCIEKNAQSKLNVKE
jgi:UDP-N-acetylmuramyl pentapeptide phosphotransferase/UDP-N-acetylglucosamine-1-phosphate transferase